LDTLEPLLLVEGLEVAYGPKQVLRGVDFSVRRGEVVALLGANGCGKSTALNAISGFVRASAGSIRFKQRDITGFAPHETFRHGIVQVSQARDLFVDLSVEDNLRLGAEVRGRGDVEAQLARVYDYFPRLEERQDLHARALSGGEQQMVALGRALMGKPGLLLLDEPSGGLAPQFVKEIGAIVARLKGEGVTMLMVEQNIALALAVGDRFIILRDGMIIEGGSVAALQGSQDEIVRTIYL